MGINGSHNHKLISNIAIDLLGNKVSLFIGAGFSADLGYPTWGRLLKGIIDKNNFMEKLVESNLFPLLREGEGNYDKINELIIDKLIGVDFLRLAGYVDTLLQNLKGDEKKDIRVEIKNEIQKYEDKRMFNKTRYEKYIQYFDILSSHVGEIITTNYDTNLEYCISNYSVIHRDLSSINRNRSEVTHNRIKIYKIHGCITDENNGIIITEKDYQDFSSTNKYISHKLYSTFMENNIVFIGYSLQDPNIRGILNEVIEEANRSTDTNKKIYWVNRDEVNKIDKEFYKDMYSIEIIDEIGILEFLESLILLTQDKWNNNKLIEEKWKDAAEELLSINDFNHIRYKNLISKIVGANKYINVLNYIYKTFIENSSLRSEAAVAYFSILLEIKGNELPELERQATDILATEDGYLLSFIKLLLDAEDMNGFFREKSYDKKLLESFISRASATIYFHQYELYSRGLLECYKALDGDLEGDREAFVDAFYSNYRYLTDTKTKGYSYLSLRTVRDLLKWLDEDIIDSILDCYPTSTKNPIQKEQIEALISAVAVESKKNQLRYDYIYKIEIYEMLQRVIGHKVSKVLIRENKFEWEHDELSDPFSLRGTLKNPADDKIMSIFENNQITSLSMDGREITFEILINQENGTGIIEVNEKQKVITDVSEVGDFVIPILEQYFRECGLL
ncbi:hypothetical protein IK3_05605 [Bacillus toyonensis]|uniref:SIR2 family protein n=1 Tax=Bacillus toyonensis TaxID=155322 RepID=UPI000279D814|nr:SIR2 family protein [Bacillus toyonensis]EJR55511.1 hypothetical protein IK3_05605 [Bacillus toyonensis]